MDAGKEVIVETSPNFNMAGDIARSTSACGTGHDGLARAIKDCSFSFLGILVSLQHRKAIQHFHCIIVARKHNH
jgi:hypothetical protein